MQNSLRGQTFATLTGGTRGLCNYEITGVGCGIAKFGAAYIMVIPLSFRKADLGTLGGGGDSLLSRSDEDMRKGFSV